MATATEPKSELNYVAPHITLNNNGVPCIDGTRFKVYLIAISHLSGLTSDQLQEAYPDLTSAQIHASLTYYYDHREELDDYISDAEKFVDEPRKRSPNRFS